MQIILRSKKEIHYATEIEKILKAMYPKFAIKVKIFPIKRKAEKKNLWYTIFSYLLLRGVFPWIILT